MSRSEHFDVVVVGSGFGGAVTTYRLAKAGLSVCLLERGKRYPPGSFPRTRRDMHRNFWDPSEGFYGLYNLWKFKGIEAVISSGLGGGSLIYANVLLRKPKEWFLQHDSYQGTVEHWPITYEDLEPHYEEVERMLCGQRYPFDHEPYRSTAKTNALKEAAASLGWEWELPKLAVTFGNTTEAPSPGEPIQEEYPNIHDRTRYTCLLCGECMIGCNYGSKNTLDHTYISAAKHEGAEIRTLCEVRSFAPDVRGSGYVVDYVQHDLNREGVRTNTRDLPRTRVTSDRLILAAGTFGTTFLLLKNKSSFPQISGRLGHRFSGNGDFLGFAIDARWKGSSTSSPNHRDFSPTVGPVITSTVRAEQGVDGGADRGFFIQEAGFPAFVTWTLAATGISGLLRRTIKMWLYRIADRINYKFDNDLSAELAAVLGKSSVFESSIPLLGMGQDVPDGVMSLRNGYLENDWTTHTSQDFFSGVRTTMRELADTWQAKYVDNPTYRLKRVITVHPLGGCPMGTDVENGVVNEYGEVFGYPGLYVADGSAMPGPTGSNPSLTIAAFANRCADAILSNVGTIPSKE